jgi:hypothetical protein
MTEQLPEGVRDITHDLTAEGRVVSISVRKDGEWHTVERFAQPISIAKARRLAEAHKKRLFGEKEGETEAPPSH